MAPQKEAEAPQPSSTKAKIQYIKEQDNKGLPMVGYFPSGFDPSKEDDQPPPTIRVYQKNKRMELVVTPSGSPPSVDFVGASNLGEGQNPQTCKYALGVLDKDTGLLKIVPIATNKVFRLDPKVRHTNSTGTELGAREEDLSKEERWAKRNQLTSLYETSRSAKQARKLHALKELGASKEGDENDGSPNKRALESTSADIARNVPPYNSSATTPHEAYPLEKIIMQGEWGFLEDIYNILQSNDEVSSDNYPLFVRNRMFKLRDMEDDEKKKQVSCIYSYITHLVKFKDQHSMEGNKSAKSHRIPDILLHKFKSMFGDGSKILSLEKTNLLMSYVLVLTLHADDFLTDPDDIAQDLRQSSIKVRPHFENLGCKFRRDNKILKADLKIPLKFPDVVMRRIRQKR
ncbi:hypothetical protein ACFE04_003975 [Oxalis oulophora]